MKKDGVLLIVGLCILAILIIAVLVIRPTSKFEVLLGEYVGIEAEVEETVVTDQDVDKAVLDSILENQESIEVTGRPVRNGDIANIDYVGKIDGVPFDHGSDTAFDLEIGSGSFINGFEEQIIGMEIGQTKDITVTFPESYSPELGGKEAVFTVKVNSISGKEIPEQITDEMIKAISETYTTVEDYKAYIRSELEHDAEEENDYNKQSAVWNVILENSTVNNPSKKKIQYYSELFESNYKYYADMYGVDLATFIKTYMQTTQEEYDKEKAGFAKESVIRSAIVNAIAAEQGISVSDEEYQKYLTEYEYGEEEKQQYGEAIKDDILYGKVMDFIISNAKITIKNSN